MRIYKHGEEHHAWKGDKIADESGRYRARKLYVNIGPCSMCGNPKSERHHKDGNTRNNELSNIQILCTRCHMLVDGRMERMRKTCKENQPLAVKKANELRAAQTHCKRGHELFGPNMFINANGFRVCRTCRRAYERAWRKAKRDNA